MFPAPKSHPLDKAYTVFRRTEGGVIVSPGIVMARDQILADTKAKRLFGHGCWAKLKETEDALE